MCRTLPRYLVAQIPHSPPNTGCCAGTYGIGFHHPRPLRSCAKRAPKVPLDLFNRVRAKKTYSRYIAWIICEQDNNLTLINENKTTHVSPGGRPSSTSYLILLYAFAYSLWTLFVLQLSLTIIVIPVDLHYRGHILHGSLNKTTLLRVYILLG